MNKTNIRYAFKLIGTKLVKVSIKKLLYKDEYHILKNLQNADKKLNIPQIIDRLCNDNQLTYHYINGTPLYKKYSSIEKLDVKESLTIFKQLLIIVDQIHKLPEGLIHNDITPGNILINKDKIIYLIDFDNVTSRYNSHMKITQGKPHYASPEQRKGLPSTQQSDIYQLGCILFELLFFKQYQSYNDIAQHDLNTLIKDKKLLKILILYLAKNPKSRYQNTTECIKSIDDYLNKS